MAGYIKLWRGWRDNPVLRGKFCRTSAWVWLIEMACWKPTQFDIKGKTVELERGQLCASREQMAKAWGWSPSAVERFLTRLQTEHMIERETGQGKSVITICNYAKYQDRNDEAGQEIGQTTGQKSDRHRTAKEEGKKVKKEEIPPNGGAGDMVKAIFSTGVSLLTAAGVPERQARSFIGAKRKQYHDSQMLVVLSRCQVEQPSDPLGWITKALQTENGDGRTNRTSGTAGADKRSGLARAIDNELGTLRTLP